MISEILNISVYKKNTLASLFDQILQGVYPLCYIPDPYVIDPFRSETISGLLLPNMTLGPLCSCDMDNIALKNSHSNYAPNINIRSMAMTALINQHV